MEPRIDYMKSARGAFHAMLGIEQYLQQSGLDESLQNLIKLRVSQMNGCAYCIDMHWKDLRAAGESEQRLYGLDTWEESPYYTDRERAALAWAESVTNIQDGHVPDAVFEGVKKFFDDNVCGISQVYFAGHDHSRQWLDEPTALCGAELIVSGAGSAYTDLKDRGNKAFYQDATETGFMYVVVDGDTFTGEFYDANGTLDFARTFTHP